MATYYVDFVNGLDANNGLGPDASHATNKPWKTITKLLSAAGMNSGDTAYLSPAGPFRETVAVAVSPVATVETKIIGDPLNAQGFKTSGGVLVAPGPIILTAYTTNDETAPSATQLLSLGASAGSFLTFEKIMFVGGNNQLLGGSTSVNVTLRDCAFIAAHVGGQILVGFTTAFGVASNILIERCHFLRGTGAAISLSIVTSAGGADYDANIQIRDCVVVSGLSSASVTIAGGAGAFRGGGIDIRNCTFLGAGAISITASTSTTIPCTINNCHIWGGSVAISAAASGQITENYNLILAGTPRTNVSAGANSISDGSVAPMMHFGQERLWGLAHRPVYEPMINSPLLGFGSDGSASSVDLYNNPRPAGGVSALPAVGALERGNTWGREISTVRTGSNALSVTGPGYQDFELAVDAASTTVTVYLRKDSTYAGTAPKLQVLAQPDIGVSAAEDTLGAAADTWEQQSLNFTPTAQGIVTIRLLSTDTNGGGKAFADDFAVT